MWHLLSDYPCVVKWTPGDIIACQGRGLLESDTVVPAAQANEGTVGGWWGLVRKSLTYPFTPPSVGEVI